MNLNPLRCDYYRVGCERRHDQRLRGDEREDDDECDERHRWVASGQDDRWDQKQQEAQGQAETHHAVASGLMKASGQLQHSRIRASTDERNTSLRRFP